MTEVVKIRGETLVLRRFDFLEQRKAAIVSDPVLDNLAQIVRSQGGENMNPTAMVRVFESHIDSYIILLGMAAHRPAEWIRTLTETEGDMLVSTFWLEHSYFFSKLFFSKLYAGIDNDSGNVLHATVGVKV